MGDSPLSEHCVQLSGLVQLLLEIKSMPTPGSPHGLVRINVVDIRLPNSDATVPSGLQLTNGKSKCAGAPFNPNQVTF